MLDKEKLKKAIAEGKVSDKTTLQIFAQNEELQQEIETKIADLKVKVDEAVKIVKESEVNLPEVLKAIKGTQGDQGIQGEKGEKGDAGKGIDGKNGKDGKNGIDGKNGENGKDGIDGVNGLDGLNGKDGSPDTRLQIVEKINTGKDKDLKIEASQVIGFEKATKDLNFALGVLDQRTQFLINKQTVSSGGGTVGPGTTDEIAYFNSATTVASLTTVTYPSLTELAYVKGVTSDIQTQLNAKAPSTAPTFATSITGSYLTASEILITDGSKNIVSAPVATYPSLTELTYVKGVTSAIQTQINTKANTAGALTQFIGNGNWKVFYSDGSGDITELALGADGTFLKSNGASSAPTFATPAGSGDVSKVGTPVNNQVGVWTGDGTLEGDAALTFDTTTDVLSSGGLLLSGLTASEIIGTDASKNLVSLAVATYPSLAELAYVKGVTSAIQTQINTKAPSTAPTFATSITGSYLTASEILITDGSKNIVSAAVATYPSLTELTYVKGVTSAIQTQLNARLPLTGGTMSGNITLGENTSIALDPAGSADGKYTGITVTGTGGETIAFGDIVTLDKDDSQWYKVDISVAAAATGDARGIVGICVLASTDNNPITVLLKGIIRADANFPALTIGAAVYASTTGDIVVTQPTTTDHVIRVVGYALTADEIYFNPENDWITHT